MTHRRAIGALIAIAALSLSACGDGSPAGEVPTALPNTEDITMTDNAYSITNLKVSTGDEVTFQFRNDGGVTHEAVIGTAAQQEAHETEMKPSANGTSDPMAGMDQGRPGTEALSLKPGKTGELVHRFTRPGTVILGCHEPGHYAAGMKITIEVS